MADLRHASPLASCVRCRIFILRPAQHSWSEHPPPFPSHGPVSQPEFSAVHPVDPAGGAISTELRHSIAWIAQASIFTVPGVAPCAVSWLWRGNHTTCSGIVDAVLSSKAPGNRPIAHRDADVFSGCRLPVKSVLLYVDITPSGMRRSPNSQSVCGRVPFYLDDACRRFDTAAEIQACLSYMGAAG